ncbi:MAG: copper resistance CopC family protein [Trueperaceae bacterium]
MTARAFVRSASRRSAVMALLLALATSAWAHTRLDASQPERDAVLDAPPEAIVLRFSDAFDLRFSRFVLIRIADDDALGPDDLQRLHGVASQVDLDDPELDPVDVELVADGDRTSEVVLRPAVPLPAGAWLVAWRVLALDGHVMHDRLLFVTTGDGPDA